MTEIDVPTGETPSNEIVRAKTFADYSPTDVRHTLEREYDLGNLQRFADRTDPIVFQYMKECMRIMQPNAFEQTLVWQVGPAAMVYDYFNIMRAIDSSLRSTKDLWDAVDSPPPRHGAGESEDKEPAIKGSLDISTAIMLAVSMPDNMTPEAVTDTNKLRKLHDPNALSRIRKRKYMQTLDGIRKRQTPKAVEAVDIKGKIQADAYRQLVLAGPQILKQLAASVEEGLSNEAVRNEFNKAEAWLLDRLKDGKSVEPVVGDEYHTVISHPEDSLVLEPSSRREFRPDYLSRMEEYRAIVDHFTAQGYIAEFSEGEVKLGEEHGIKLSDESGKRATGVLLDAVEPVDTGTFDIARLRRPDSSSSEFEMEHFPGGSCYVIHPGIKQFWKQVFGDNVSFADITNNMSRRTMRILGAHPIDHIEIGGVSWQQRVIDYLEKLDGYKTLDIMLADWFTPFKPGESSYLKFDESGLLKANTLNRRSKTGQKEWDEQIPNSIVKGMNSWLDKNPENKSLLQQGEFIKLARTIAGDNTGAVTS